MGSIDCHSYSLVHAVAVAILVQAMSAIVVVGLAP